MAFSYILILCGVLFGVTFGAGFACGIVFGLRKATAVLCPVVTEIVGVLKEVTARPPQFEGELPQQKIDYTAEMLLAYGVASTNMLPRSVREQYNIPDDVSLSDMEVNEHGRR